MLRTCKGLCDGKCVKNTFNIYAYDNYNRCTICSDLRQHCWWPKAYHLCPCCGAKLRQHSHQKKPMKRRLEISARLI